VTDLLIHAGRVFTAAESEPLLHETWVRVDGDRIVEVTSTQPKAGAGTQKSRQAIQPSYRA
jgi:predicted amidohydrolase YtcJ